MSVRSISCYDRTVSHIPYSILVVAGLVGAASSCAVLNYIVGSRKVAGHILNSPAAVFFLLNDTLLSFVLVSELNCSHNAKVMRSNCIDLLVDDLVVLCVETDCVRASLIASFKFDLVFSNRACKLIAFGNAAGNALCGNNFCMVDVLCKNNMAFNLTFFTADLAHYIGLIEAIHSRINQNSFTVFEYRIAFFVSLDIIKISVLYTTPVVIGLVGLDFVFLNKTTSLALIYYGSMSSLCAVSHIGCDRSSLDFFPVMAKGLAGKELIGIFHDTVNNSGKHYGCALCTCCRGFLLIGHFVLYDLVVVRVVYVYLCVGNGALAGLTVIRPFNRFSVIAIGLAGFDRFCFGSENCRGHHAYCHYYAESNCSKF